MIKVLFCGPPLCMTQQRVSLSLTGDKSLLQLLVIPSAPTWRLQALNSLFQPLLSVIFQENTQSTRVSNSCKQAGTTVSYTYN